MIKVTIGRDIDHSLAFTLISDGTEAMPFLKIVLNDNTGGRGPAEKIKVEISPDCCPLALVITITF